MPFHPGTDGVVRHVGVSIHCGDEVPLHLGVSAEFLRFVQVSIHCRDEVPLHPLPDPRAF